MLCNNVTEQNRTSCVISAAVCVKMQIVEEVIDQRNLENI